MNHPEIWKLQKSALSEAFKHKYWNLPPKNIFRINLQIEYINNIFKYPEDWIRLCGDRFHFQNRVSLWFSNSGIQNLIAEFDEFILNEDLNSGIIRNWRKIFRSSSNGNCWMEAISIGRVFNFVGFPVGTDETERTFDDYRFLISSLVLKFTSFLFLLSIALYIWIMVTINSDVVIFFLADDCNIVRILLGSSENCDDKQRK